MLLRGGNSFASLSHTHAAHTHTHTHAHAGAARSYDRRSKAMLGKGIAPEEIAAKLSYRPRPPPACKLIGTAWHSPHCTVCLIAKRWAAAAAETEVAAAGGGSGGGGGGGSAMD